MTTWVDVRRWTDRGSRRAMVQHNMSDMAMRVLLVDEEQAEYMLIANYATAIGRHRYLISWCDRPDQALTTMLSGEYYAIQL